MRQVLTMAAAWLAIGCAAAEAREWKNADGQVRCEAEALSVRGGLVYLEQADGTVVKVPLAELSRPDQEHLATLPQCQTYFRDHPLEPAAAPALPRAPEGKYAIVKVGEDGDDFVGEMYRCDEFAGQPRCVACSPNPQLVAVGLDNATVVLLDLETSRIVATHTPRNSEFRPLQPELLTFTPDGTLLVVYLGNYQIDALAPSPDGTFREVGRFVGHQEPVLALDVSGDSRRVLSGGAEESVRCWSLESFRQIGEAGAFERSVTSCCLSRSGRQGLAADDSQIQLLDFESGQVLQTMDLNRLRRRPLCFSPDGTLAAAHDSSEFAYLDPRRGTVSLHQANSPIRRFPTFTPDGNFMLTSVGENIELWDIARAERIGEFKTAGGYSLRGLAVSSDGRRVVCVTDKTPMLQVFQLPVSAAK